MSLLNEKQLKDYKDNGFISPIDVLTLEEAAKHLLLDIQKDL